MSDSRLQLVATRDVFRCDRRWPSCHCATVAAAPDGQITAAWYAGAYEKAADEAILMARCHLPTYQWEPAYVVIDTPGKADGNPVLWFGPSGRLWLFFVTIFGQDWDECKMFMQSSPDGHVWSSPKVLREEWGWMTRAKPLVLADGTVLLPMYDERDWSSHVLIHEGEGRWRRFGHVTASQGLIQPSLVDLGSGHVRMYLRTGGLGGSVWYSDSGDSGQTWAYPQPTGLPNPNSGIDALRLRNGLLVMAYNDSSERRTPLCLAVSEDDGGCWRTDVTVASGAGEYSYPTLGEDAGGNLHLLYTHRRLAIRHCVYHVRS